MIRLVHVMFGEGHCVSHGWKCAKYTGQRVGSVTYDKIMESLNIVVIYSAI